MSNVFVGCGVADLLLGDTCLVTGLADEPDGSLRVYVGPRYRNVYVVIEAVATKEQDAVRAAWNAGGKVLIPKPPTEALCQAVARV